MKILVTGASGFIGSHVVEQLVRLEHSIVVTARSHEKLAQYAWFSKVKFVALDLNSLSGTEHVYDLFGKPDLLIHLAWEGLPNYRASFHMEKNYPAQYKFLKQMIEGGLPSLTVTGTCLEYGMQKGCLSEDLSIEPMVPYAQAKNRLRESLVDLQKTHAFSLKWIRLFYTYGSGQNENAILSQLDRALEQGKQSFNMSGGEQLRDYVPIETMAEYIVKIALQNKVNGIINCCSGQPISIKQFIKNYLSMKNKNISLNLGHYPYLDYEPMEFWGDTRKLRQALQ